MVRRSRSAPVTRTAGSLSAIVQSCSRCCGCPEAMRSFRCGAISRWSKRRTGLAIPLTTDLAKPWSLYTLQPAPGYVGAPAIEGTGWRPSQWHWQSRLSNSSVPRLRPELLEPILNNDQLVGCAGPDHQEAPVVWGHSILRTESERCESRGREECC